MKPKKSLAAMESVKMPSLKKRYSLPGADTDSVAQAGVLDDHMGYTKQQLASLRERLEVEKDPETKADIQKDLDFWMKHGLKMSKMGFAGDPTDNISDDGQPDGESTSEDGTPTIHYTVRGKKAAAQFDPSRPLGMR